MTKAELIARLSAKNPQLYLRDIERIVSTIFEEISEIQVTGEEFFFTDNQFAEMFSLAKIGVKEIISRQKEALK